MNCRQSDAGVNILVSLCSYWEWYLREHHKKSSPTNSDWRHSGASPTLTALYTTYLKPVTAARTSCLPPLPTPLLSLASHPSPWKRFLPHRNGCSLLLSLVHLLLSGIQWRFGSSRLRVRSTWYNNSLSLLFPQARGHRLGSAGQLYSSAGKQEKGDLLGSSCLGDWFDWWRVASESGEWWCWWCYLLASGRYVQRTEKQRCTHKMERVQTRGKQRGRQAEPQIMMIRREVVSALFTREKIQKSPWVMHVS